MRVLILTFLILLAPPAAMCQSSTQDNLQQVVRAILDAKGHPLLIEGPMDGSLNRAGDGAAVVITKVVTGRDLSSDEIDRILLVIHMSFAAPKIVEVESDRQPRTTLFVLKYLQGLPVSPALKQRIAETKAFVEQSAKPGAAESARPGG